MDTSLLFFSGCFLIILGATISGLARVSQEASEVGFNLSLFGYVITGFMIGDYDGVAITAKFAAWVGLTLGLTLGGLLVSDVIERIIRWFPRKPAPQTLQEN